MKLKTINSIICRKFDAWLASIQDESTRQLAEKNMVCTGGAIASLLLNEAVNDFDFYARNVETTRALAHYYVNRFKANPPPKFKDARGEVEIKVNEIPDSE